MKVYQISNNTRTRCISPKRSSEVISYLVPELFLIDLFVSKISAVSDQRHVVGRSGTNQICGFHVLDRSQK